MPPKKLGVEVGLAQVGHYFGHGGAYVQPLLPHRVALAQAQGVHAGHGQRVIEPEVDAQQLVGGGVLPAKSARTGRQLGRHPPVGVVFEVEELS